VLPSVADIKLATKVDCDTLSQLFNRYRIFYNMPSDLKAAKTFITQRLLKQDSLLYLATKNNEALGFTQIYRSFSSVAMRPIWIINDLYVDASERNNNIATNLLSHVLKQAIKQKVFNLQLATGIDNSQAQALYAKLGYQLNNGFLHYSLLINSIK